MFVGSVLVTTYWINIQNIVCTDDFLYFISDYSSTMTTEKKYFGIPLLIFLAKQWNEFMLVIYAMDHLSKKASIMTCIPTNIG